jgi:molybdopterin converting factor small subunit
MDLTAAASAQEIRNLTPEPGEEWRRLLKFVGLTREDKLAMSRTPEVLMRKAPDMVVDTYNYLQSVPETAAILGWEGKFDAKHLEERRRFFTVWIARVIGMDTSEEFAYYLFRAGKYHAGHGPRHIHVPSAYVTTSIGMMGAAFARCMYEADLPGDVVAPAIAGWNKYLSVQLHLMDMGYQVAREFERGDFSVSFDLYGRMRQLAGWRTIKGSASEGETLESALRKLFNYAPELRAEALRPVWHSHEKEESLWVEVYQTYVPTPGGWRFLLNGRNAGFESGFEKRVNPQDVISIFPPGR